MSKNDIPFYTANGKMQSALFTPYNVNGYDVTNHVYDAGGEGAKIFKLRMTAKESAALSGSAGLSSYYTGIETINSVGGAPLFLFVYIQDQLSGVTTQIFGKKFLNSDNIEQDLFNLMIAAGTYVFPIDGRGNKYINLNGNSALLVRIATSTNSSHYPYYNQNGHVVSAYGEEYQA